MPKREDYISWDEYFMGVSLLASMRSKDPNTQVGACIVSDDNKILSVGYNGFPRGCSDDEFPWERSAAHPNDTKYPFVCHAELKAIIQSGIKEVIYISDKYADSPSTLASKTMFKAAGVKLTHFDSDKSINISFNADEI
jgi:dCMP deaminase